MNDRHKIEKGLGALEALSRRGVAPVSLGEILRTRWLLKLSGMGKVSAVVGVLFIIFGLSMWNEANFQWDNGRGLRELSKEACENGRKFYGRNVEACDRYGREVDAAAQASWNAVIVIGLGTVVLAGFFGFVRPYGTRRARSLIEQNSTAIKKFHESNAPDSITLHQPEPLMTNESSTVGDLGKLHELLKAGAITQEEFDQQKKKLLAS